MRKILPLFIIALVTACSPKVRTQPTENKPSVPLNATKTVSVIDLDQTAPASAIKLGTVKVTDSGLTLKCDWQTILEKAEIEAMKIGGNVLKITRHTLPGLMSSCHQIEADIYYVSDGAENPIPQISNSTQDSLKNLNNQSPKSYVTLPFQKYRIAFSGGASFLIGKTGNEVPAEFKPYINELKSGSHISIDGGYFWKENIGLGLKYSSFFSKNSMSNIYITDNNGQTRYGSMSDNINTQFIGANLYNRGYSKNRKTVWFANVSLGYIDYRNDAKLIDDLKITGSTFGAGFDLGVDFNLAKNFYFSLGAGYTAGLLKQLKYSDSAGQRTIKLEKNQYESMNRIDLSAGIRWAW